MCLIDPQRKACVVVCVRERERTSLSTASLSALTKRSYPVNSFKIAQLAFISGKGNCGEHISQRTVHRMFGLLLLPGGRGAEQTVLLRY